MSQKAFDLFNQERLNNWIASIGFYNGLFDQTSNLPFEEFDQSERDAYDKGWFKGKYRRPQIEKDGVYTLSIGFLIDVIDDWAGFCAESSDGLMGLSRGDALEVPKELLVKYGVIKEQ